MGLGASTEELGVRDEKSEENKECLHSGVPVAFYRGLETT